MNRVAIVVVNYKGIEDTKSAIASLAKQSFPDFTIVAVENGSHDGSAEVFHQLEHDYGKKLVALYNDKNTGFDGGVNTGIKWAFDNNCEYVILFNNDAIADPKWVESLVTTADKKQDCAMVTGLLLHQDGKTIDSTGDWYSTWGLPFPRNRGDKTSVAPTEGEVFGATGGATLHRIATLKEIGIFDEDFFAYYEDVDISFRAQLMGWKVYYQPKAIAYHQQGGTSSKMPGFTVYQTFKNLPLVYIKNVPFGLLFPIGVRFYAAYWLMYFKALLRGDFIPATKGLLQGIWYSLKALGKRRHIQRTKKVSTTYIKSILWPDLPPDQTGLRKLRRFFIGK